MEATTATTVTTARRTRWAALVAAIVSLGALALVTLMAKTSSGSGGGDPVQAVTDSGVTSRELDRVRQMRIFFAHQSVGANLLDAVPGIYSALGMTAPDITTQQRNDDSAGSFLHAFIGVNGKPLGKIEDFDSMIRSGAAGKPDVALVKLCYDDVTAGTDIDALFSAYRETLTGLERDFPGTTFLHVTTPLTTEPGLKGHIKRLLGRAGDSRADNVARERYNALMREQYGATGHVFDLASVESTAPDGTVVGGEFEGSTYYALSTAYAADPGHLNEFGGTTAASELLRVIAAVG